MCKFRRFTTCPSFFNCFLLIFHICTFQWLNCTNLKDEINRSYNGGEVVYVLKSALSRSSLQYHKYIPVLSVSMSLSISIWIPAAMMCPVSKLTSVFSVILLKYASTYPISHQSTESVSILFPSQGSGRVVCYFLHYHQWPLLTPYAEYHHLLRD